MTGPEDELPARATDDAGLPERSEDDRDVGWGDDVRETAARDTDEWYLSERPPHHGT